MAAWKDFSRNQSGFSFAGPIVFHMQNVAPNQPVRMNGETHEPELGQAKFSGVVVAWNAIK